MKPELEIKELYTKAVNRCKMLDFVEAEKLFLKILEIMYSFLSDKSFF